MFGNGTDLADLYRNEMTLRQLYVRVAALPPESQVAAIVREARAAEEKARAEGRIDAALALVQPKEG